MSVRASGEIARLVRSRVSALGYTNVDDKTKHEGLYGLKERLFYGPCEIKIFAPTRFEATLMGTNFNQAIRKDFFDGLMRIRQLQHAAACLTDRNAATAWVLTTCYYISFFAAIEILRCSGRLVSYFGETAVEALTERAITPVPARIEPGTYEGSVAFDAVTGEITVAYAKRNIRHHDFTWQQIKQIINQTRKDLSGIDAVIQERLEQFIGSNARPFWPSPSDTRNLWNYEEAALFGRAGEHVGREFKKLARSKSSALSWGTAKKMFHSKETCACSVAFVMSILVSATDDLSAALLPTSLSRDPSHWNRVKDSTLS